MTTVDDFLEHHGVKGMKWGIRNPRNRVKKGRSRPASADSRRVSELKKKKPSQLTNKQLKAVQERVNLERSFRQATPKKIEKGHAFAKTVLAVGSTAASLYALSQSPGGKRLISMGKSFVDVALKVTPANKSAIDVSKFQKSVKLDL